MKPKFRKLCLGSSIAAFLSVPAAHAATFTWTNLDNGTPVTNGNWSGGESWSAVPVSAADTTLGFGYTYGSNSTAETNTLTNNVANPFLLNVLTFTGSPTAANGSNNALINIAGSPLDFVLNGATTPQVNLNANRSNGQLVTFNVQNNVTLSANTLFTGNGTASFTVSGGISGAGNLSKGGTSRLVLSGTNSYAGTTTISGGMLQFTNQVSLYNNTPASWTASNIRVASGATLALEVGGTNQFTTASVTTILNNLGGANGSSSGGFAAGSAIGLVNAGTVSIADTITDTTGTGGGALGITKFGAGTLTLTGANTYTGTTSILQGNLTLAPTAGGMTLGAITATTGATPALGIAAANKTLTLGGAGTNSITSILETSGAGQQLTFTKNTAATWTVGNVNVRSGNNHTVSAGILNLNGTFEWTDGNFDRRITVSAGQLNYNNAGALKTNNGRLIMTGGSMDNTSGAAITTSTHNPGLELGGNWTFIGSNGADSNLNFGTGIVRITGTAGTNRTINVQNAATKLTLGGAISSFTAWNNGNALPNTPAANGLIKAGDGTLVLTGTNTYTGNTEINGGTLEIGSTASLPGWNVNGRYSVANNATLAVRNAVTDGQIASMLGTTNFQAGSRLGFDTESGDRTYSPTITDTTQGALGLTKMGANTLTLTNTNSYTGATNVNAGTLLIDGTGAINTSSAINVAAGASFVYNSSVALTVAPTLNGTGTGASQRATLAGEGTINASVALDNLGDVLSPGNSPGNLNFAVSQSWASFTYEWELNSWDDQVANTNFDTISITGTLDLTGMVSDSYMLEIISLTGLNVAGTLDDFSEIDRTWTILTTTGGISGFDAAFWDINTAGFLPNTFTGTWSLGLGNSDNDLVLSYTALSGPLDVIPEPSTALLGSISLLAVLRRRR